MTGCTTDLVDRLAVPDKTGLDPVFLVPLLRLLASGEPVELTTALLTAVPLHDDPQIAARGSWRRRDSAHPESPSTATSNAGPSHRSDCPLDDPNG